MKCRCKYFLSMIKTLAQITIGKNSHSIKRLKKYMWSSLINMDLGQRVFILTSLWRKIKDCVGALHYIWDGWQSGVKKYTVNYYNLK